MVVDGSAGGCGGCAQRGVAGGTPPRGARGGDPRELPPSDHATRRANLREVADDAADLGAEIVRVEGDDTGRRGGATRRSAGRDARRDRPSTAGARGATAAPSARRGPARPPPGRRGPRGGRRPPGLICAPALRHPMVRTGAGRRRRVRGAARGAGSWRGLVVRRPRSPGNPRSPVESGSHVRIHLAGLLGRLLRLHRGHAGARPVRLPPEAGRGHAPLGGADVGVLDQPGPRLRGRRALLAGSGEGGRVLQRLPHRGVAVDRQRLRLQPRLRGLRDPRATSSTGSCSGASSGRS